MKDEGEGLTCAIIGGTGLEQAFLDLEELPEIATPYGPTSAPVRVGVVGGRPTAFLPRHGRDHALPPSRVPARANAWALASLGVQAVVSSAAVGSLNPGMPPSALVIPDQLLDRTRTRADTFFDAEERFAGGPVHHLPFADPFCPRLRQAAISAVPHVVPQATVAVIEGPKFSTRAESRALRREGADLVNMTLCPEVALAAELGMGTVTLCVVTDMDAGVDENDADTVSADLVYERFAAALPGVIAALESVVEAVPPGYRGRQLLDAGARAAVLARAPQ